MIIVISIIIDTFMLGGNNNGDADDPHLSNAVISIFVQNSMPPFVEFGHKILSQLNFGINVVDKWCLVSITCGVFDGIFSESTGSFDLAKNYLELFNGSQSQKNTLYVYPKHCMNE